MAFFVVARILFFLAAKIDVIRALTGAVALIGTPKQMCGTLATIRTFES
jgi:hypothetical protein